MNATRYMILCTLLTVAGIQGVIVYAKVVGGFGASWWIALAPAEMAVALFGIAALASWSIGDLDP